MNTYEKMQGKTIHSIKMDEEERTISLSFSDGSIFEISSNDYMLDVTEER